jgi:methylmalonyl-CoA/ethylmalonyl-CoA epimerase
MDTKTAQPDAKYYGVQSGMDLVFHHLGVACRDLDAEEQVWTPLGYVRESADFEDPRQQIRGRFLVGPGPRLELLVGTPGSTVLDPWLSRGIKIYHQAFEVPAVAGAIEALVVDGARVVVEPVPAVAFGGREIAFLMLRNGSLIEVIQRPG